LSGIPKLIAVRWILTTRLLHIFDRFEVTNPTIVPFNQFIAIANQKPRETESLVLIYFPYFWLNENRKKRKWPGQVDTFSLSRPRNQNASNVVNTAETKTKMKMKREENKTAARTHRRHRVTHVTHSTEVERRIKLETNKISLGRTNKQTNKQQILYLLSPCVTGAFWA